MEAVELRRYIDETIDTHPNTLIIGLVSPTISPSVQSCVVEYDKYESLVEDPDRRDGRPTDHRPVTVTLTLL